MRRFEGLGLAVWGLFALQILCLLDPAQGATLTKLHSFCATVKKGTCLDGRYPASNLVEYRGHFYGVTTLGGITDNGTVFRVSASGDFKTIHSFCTQTETCRDGQRPGVRLSLGPGGNLYGVTTTGIGTGKQGAVFKISAYGHFTTLHTFCAQPACADGSQPVSVVSDAAGNLYGTTLVGGAYREGIVFKITSSGTFSKLYDFCSAANCNDGSQPGSLMLGQDKYLYGTTAQGGANGGGTVFRVSPDGRFLTLYSFCSLANCTDSAEPVSPLSEAADGSFYGAAQDENINNFNGALFNLTQTGTLTVLHDFCVQAQCSDGNTPFGGMAAAADGSFYGAAAAGGKYYNGLIFNITPAGKYSVVYNFCSRSGCFDGSSPASSPIVASDGNLYGITLSGGDNDNAGAVYKLTP